MSQNKKVEEAEREAVGQARGEDLDLFTFIREEERLKDERS